MDGVLRFVLRDISQGESARTAELAAADLDLLVADAEFAGPVRVELSLVRVDEQVQFRGRALLRVRQQCVRCLDPVECELQVPIEAVARRRGVRETDRLAADGLILHDGEEIDLAGEVRELILLGIPQTPVCREDCPGLCPQCGAQRSAGACGCEKVEPVDPRWRGLQSLQDAPKPRSKERTK